METNERLYRPLRRLEVFLLIFTTSFLTLSCQSSDDDLKQALKNSLSQKPEILIEIIEENPLAFTETIQRAFNASRQKLAQDRREQEQKDFSQSFESPLKPLIRSDEVIRGTPGARLTLVEYIDFECPFCARGYETVQQLEQRFDGNIQIVLKHFPLSFHEGAMPAARYYEALRLQRQAYAIAFYHQVFKAQARLENGDMFLREIAEKIGADMKLLRKDLLTNEAIDERINEDMLEAKKFGFRGTPGFILNGIPIRGAYPIEYFERVITELERREMVNLAGDSGR